MTAAFVGIEPEGALRLARAADGTAADTGVAARRVAALLAEAGEQDAVSPRLRELEAWLESQSGDIRRRAALTAFTGPSGVDPTCEVPWTDPLVRAARAVRSNAARVGKGGVDSVVEGAAMVWQLVPVNDGWRNAWVDLGAGLATAVRDPRGTATAMVDFETLDEEGFSYWIGGFVPDAASVLLGGAGAAKTGLRVAEKAADAAHAATAGRRMSEALGRLPWRRGGAPDVDVPPHAGPRPPRSWRVERRARAEVRAEDHRATVSPVARGDGHGARLHGPKTSLRQQLIRTMTGRKPDGKLGFPVNGSRFFRWQDQEEAIRRAKAQWTGQRWIEVPLEHPIGEGYMKGTLEYRRTTVALVRFDTLGNAYTSYPLLEEGGPLP